MDRRALLSFLQYRANAFDADTFSELLDAMPDSELQELIDSYIDEEVLYREAESLGLEANDYIIRQRMIQKMSFLLSDIAERGVAVSDEELATWFEANIEAYAIQPWTTFTHVFFDAERRGEAGARQAAEETLALLNESGAGFNDSYAHGDRFPFLRNYVERTYEHVASHFGYDFAAQLAGLAANDSNWQGPIGSALGQHVVLVARQAERAYPPLEDVRAEVERDYATERSRAALAEMTEALRARYDIELRELRPSQE